MIRFYTNRQLSDKLNVHLAKWKRWSREFLPPDPLGGLQSGYARQYSQQDAFTVYLGGYLVRDLNFTIPEAKKILLDLREPLAGLGFFDSYDRVSKSDQEMFKFSKTCHIFIEKVKTLPQGKYDFNYRIRGNLSEETVEMHSYPVRQVRYVETVLAPVNTDPLHTDISPVKILPVSALFHHFLKVVNTHTK